MIALDTNVLLYARDPRDPRKQALAIHLIRSQADCALLWQVSCEYLAASRKLSAYGFGPPEAARDLDDLRRSWTLVLPAWSAFDRAIELMSRFSLSVWDALLLAAAIEAGIDTLYSEDFGPYPEVSGLRLVNPFA